MLPATPGTCGDDPTKPNQRPLAIANPSLAPYGVAAQTVLTGRYGLEAPPSSNPAIVEYAKYHVNLSMPFWPGLTSGICAIRAICSDGHYPTQGSSALAYFSIEGGTTPGTIVNNYNPLTQAGIAINNRRTSAQNTELEAFVDFLTDFTTSPSPDSPMMATLKKYCYNAPKDGPGGGGSRPLRSPPRSFAAAWRRPIGASQSRLKPAASGQQRPRYVTLSASRWVFRPVVFRRSSKPRSASAFDNASISAAPADCAALSTAR